MLKVTTTLQSNAIKKPSNFIHNSRVPEILRQE